MRLKGRLLILSLALGIPSNSARAFDQQKWADACQRAIKSVDACDLTDTYIEFACNRTAANSQTASEARTEIETTLRPLCTNGDDVAQAGRNDGSGNTKRTVTSGEGTHVVAPMPCVITTACSDMCDLADDCYELTSLRKFRERYMTADPVRSKAVGEYYRRSTEILTKLSNHDDRIKILAKSYAFYILPAALMATAGLDRLCYSHYCRGIKFLQTAAALGK